jgi:cytochrome d ubiquinol oxidase subunit I
MSIPFSGTGCSSPSRSSITTFPQLTMGLALLIVVLKWLGLRDDAWNDAARFWIRIFGINFAVGVVTGVPMEFQFGTNWARFSRYAGGVIGQTLAMEGCSRSSSSRAFLALLVFGERRLGPRGTFSPRRAVRRSWLSGYFIVATNAFMQHPSGTPSADGASAARRLLAFLSTRGRSRSTRTRWSAPSSRRRS